MKRILKTAIFLSLFVCFVSIIMLLFFLFNKSFNIVCIRISSGLLCGLSSIIIVYWELYINDVECKHIKKYQTESGCYKAAKPISKIRGIVIFCTDCNEPHLSRYVDCFAELGYNKEKNHWNNSQNIDMPHEFIGYDKNDNITIINTIPYGYSCFLNRNIDTSGHNSLLDNYIKIYICKEDFQNQVYFNDAICRALVNLCSKLCKKYKLKPNDIILDAQLINCMSSTCTDWFSQNQYSINQLRYDVKSRSTPIMLFGKGNRNTGNGSMS